MTVPDVKHSNTQTTLFYHTLQSGSFWNLSYCPQKSPEIAKCIQSLTLNRFSILFFTNILKKDAHIVYDCSVLSF